jgi:hypothetical protein
LARYRDHLVNRWLAYAPALLLLALLVPLPWLFEFAVGKADRLFEQTLFRDGASAFAGDYWVVAAAVLAMGVAISLNRRWPAWQGLVMIGFLQASLLSLWVVPQVFEVYQGPVKEAALLAKAEGKTVVRYRAYQPSFSVYRQAIVRSRPPRVGEWVLVRVDNLQHFAEQYPDLRTHLVYARGPTRLLEVLGIRDAGDT